MALTGDETFGTVVPGFVTDAAGNLVVTETGSNPGKVVPGFLTDDDGRLVVAEESGNWKDGLIRNSAGALCVTTGVPTQLGTKVPGLPTNDAGVLVVADTPGATTLGNPFPGLYVNADKALAVTGLGGGSGVLYQETFDVTEGGWEEITGSGYDDRVTSNTHSGAGCLRCECAYVDTQHASPPFPCTGFLSGTIWARNNVGQNFGSDRTLALVVFECDADGNTIDGGGAALLGLASSIQGLSSWTEFTSSTPTPWVAGGTHGRVVVIQNGSTADSGPTFLLDDVTIEGTS